MTGTDEKIPVVFISYSHDSKEHKRWVAEFASKLMENGIDVILDQWDLGLGDDVPKFMEASFSRADHVLMICSETYVRKADDGRGGVGYEAMIVTGEIVKNLGTSKFIPIIRQSPGSVTLPKSLSTRHYVNLNEEKDFDEGFARLLHRLHNIPEVRKPPLGKSLFSIMRDLQPTKESNVSPETMPLAPYEDTGDVYRGALSFARSSDLVGWRKLIRAAKKSLLIDLADWRAKYENAPLPDESQLVHAGIEGVDAFGPLISIALAGVESGRDNFTNQIALVDEILFPMGWNPAGRAHVVYMPELAVYVYQGLHGAMCLQTGQLPLALGLASTNVENRNRSEAFILWEGSNLIGWPESLGRKATVAWDVLATLPQNCDGSMNLSGAMRNSK